MKDANLKDLEATVKCLRNELKEVRRNEKSKKKHLNFSNFQPSENLKIKNIILQ